MVAHRKLEKTKNAVMSFFDFLLSEDGRTGDFIDRDSMVEIDVPRDALHHLPDREAFDLLQLPLYLVSS